MPSLKNIFTVESDFFKDFYRNRNPEGKTFKLHTVSEEYIFKELSKLNCSKSAGLDNIPASFLKDVTFLVNSSIVSGTEMC